MKTMTLEQIKAFINVNTWVFAKSMPTMPHWYIVRDKCTDESLFIEFVLFIRANGIPKKFFRSTYIYYVVDGFEYWTMGSPIEVTKIINRASLS